MCAAIHAVGIDADLLFVDDNSPDGTGRILDALRAEYPRLIVHHRTGKLGIGSAHAEGIRWAYDQGYEMLVTMDGDFSHTPTDIPAMIQLAAQNDVAVASRWVNPNSLPGWNLFRRATTIVGHFLTQRLLGIPQDASGAFRAYRLARIPREVFQLVQSREYSFFFESLFVLNKNELRIAELPIVLPNRTYGSSKMSIAAALRSGRFVFELYFAYLRAPDKFRVSARKLVAPHA